MLYILSIENAIILENATSHNTIIKHRNQTGNVYISFIRSCGSFGNYNGCQILIYRFQSCASYVMAMWCIFLTNPFDGVDWVHEEWSSVVCWLPTRAVWWHVTLSLLTTLWHVLLAEVQSVGVTSYFCVVTSWCCLRATSYFCGVTSRRCQRPGLSST